MSTMEIGGACWDRSYVDRMLTSIAQVGADANAWFLATHSPITYRAGNQERQQEDLFRELFRTQRRDYLAVVNGEPGSGKSQLINWLKLRFDSAIADGQKTGFGDVRLRTVLVRRRSGSLKDALQQLVDQLPELHTYLEKIRSAIDFVAGEQANQRLYSEMFHSLDAVKEFAPISLRKLHEVFMDTNAMKHMCRVDGAIDLNVKRLVEASDINQRASLPPFTTADFQFPLKRNVGFDEDLKDRLEEDALLCAEAAEWANRHLRQAIAGLTGLKGHTLNEVFRDIRAELNRRGEALALFIEDVSTLSVLDAELVNALQPLSDNSLCPLISVLGMTLDAYGRLPDNLTQRLNLTLELSDSSSLRASESDGAAVDGFIGRYLNALRFGESKIQMLADDVRDSDAISHSACDACALKESCFSAFGSVTVGQVEVGLYPMSPGSSLRLLNGLTEERLPKTPRTLLQHVLEPMLKATVREWQGRSIPLSIQPRVPHDMNAQEGRLLAGWTSEQRSRMAYFVYYWIGENSLQGGAQSMTDMLPWWGLPSFSSLPVVSTQATSSPFSRGESVRTVTHTTSRRLEDDEPSADYTEAMGRLSRWHLNNEPLRNDATFRTLLLNAVKNSLPREEFRTPSHRIQRFSSSLSSSSIEIEGQVTRTAIGSSRGRFYFPRGDETYDLLRTLLDFKYRGDNSWEYAGGESGRRQYGSWLAANTEHLIQFYGFGVSVRETAVALATRFLRTAYRVCNRKDLPSDTGEAVQALMSFAPVVSVCLSPELQRLANDLPERVSLVRAELMDELAVRQGDGGLLYIDPCPIIENLNQDLDLSQVQWPAEANKSEFPQIFGLANSTEWRRFDEALESERNQLSRQIQSLESVLRRWAISTESIPEGTETFLKSSREVVQALRATNRNLGSDTLQSQLIGLTPSVVGKHVNLISDANLIVERDPAALLGLDVKEVSASLTLISSADQALAQTQSSLSNLLNNVVTSIDVEQARAAAIEIFEKFEVSTPTSVQGEEGSQ
jgi:hypothetical protein